MLGCTLFHKCLRGWTSASAGPIVRDMRAQHRVICRCFLLKLLAVSIAGFCIDIPSSHAEAQDQKRSTIRGFVYDRTTLVAISEAAIIASGTTRAVTDRRGYFSFSAAAETIEVQVRMIGYVPAAKVISLSQEDFEANVFFELVPAPIQIDSMLITASREKDYRPSGVLTLHAAEITSVPRFVESDPLRTIQALPGVTVATTDFDAHIYLRGGNAEETQVQLDGVPIYNPYHLGGWLSVINSEVVASQELFRSNYPVSSSGVLSGIVDLESRNPPSDRFYGSASVGFPTMSADIAGPLWTGGVLISARRTYLDLIVDRLAGDKKNKLPYYFFDVYAKAVLPTSPSSTLSLSVLFARDSFDPFANRDATSIRVEELPSWENRIISLAYTAILGGSSSINMLFYSTRSRVGSSAEGRDTFPGETERTMLGPSRSFKITNTVDETAGKMTFHLDGQSHHFLAGFELKRLALAYSWRIDWPSYNDLEERVLPRPDAFYDYATEEFEYARNSGSFAGFVSDRLKLSESTELTLGYRIQSLEQPKVVLHSPYVDLTHTFTSGRATLKFGKYYQSLYSLKENKNADNLSSTFTALFLSEDGRKIGESDHLAVGVQIDSLPWALSLDAESYYKGRRHLATAYQDPDFRVAYEDGYAIGVDILLRYKGEMFSGWIGYSISRSVKSNDQTYYAAADRTHSLKCFVQMKPLESLRLDVFWTYASGTPYTSIAGKYVGMDEPPGNSPSDGLVCRAVYGPKNAARAIDYNRLDVGITWLLIWSDLLVSPYISVYNITRSPNPYFVNWPSDNSIENARASELVPTIGITVRF